MPTHSYSAGTVNLHKRDRSRFWQYSAVVGGRRYRKSTKEENLLAAREFAEDWLLELRGKHRVGALKREKTFVEAADKFWYEYVALTKGERNARWVESHETRLRIHLLPFFGKMGLSEITAGKVQEYRIHRIQSSPTGKPPAKWTIHHDIVTLRQVMKTALRHNWIAHIPVSDVSAYGTDLGLC